LRPDFPGVAADQRRLKGTAPEPSGRPDTFGRPKRGQLFGVGLVVEKIGQSSGRARQERRRFDVSVIAPLEMRPHARLRPILRVSAITLFHGLVRPLFDGLSGGWADHAPTRSSMPSCSRPSRTLRAADAVARSRAILDRRCARRHGARAGRDGRMAPIEQKDGTQEAIERMSSSCGRNAARRLLGDFPRYRFPHAVESAGSGSGQRHDIAPIVAVFRV